MHASTSSFGYQVSLVAKLRNRCRVLAVPLFLRVLFPPLFLACLSPRSSFRFPLFSNFSVARDTRVTLQDRIAGRAAPLWGSRFKCGMLLC